MSFIYALTATWNNATTLYTGVGLNISNGAGGVATYLGGSRVVELQNNGVEFFAINPDGTVVLADNASIFWNGLGIFMRSTSVNNVILTSFSQSGVVQPRSDTYTYGGLNLAFRVFGNDTTNVNQLAAVINPGISTPTAGALRGAIDFVCYKDSFVEGFHIGMTCDGANGIFPVVNPNNYMLGDNVAPWHQMFADELYSSKLFISGTSLVTLPPAGPTGTVAQITAGNSINGATLLDAFAQSSSLIFRRADTSLSSPSAVQSGESLGQNEWIGRGATGYGTTAAKIRAQALETFTDTAKGTSLIFSVNTITSVSLVDMLTLTTSGLIFSGGGTAAWIALPPSSTALASINFPATGAAPSSPNNGDFWFDGTNLKIRIAGATKTVTVT